MIFQLVNNLSMNVRNFIVGKDAQKVTGFIQCCAAYCCVTVPSVICPFKKLQLYLLSAQVALINQCFLQGVKKNTLIYYNYLQTSSFSLMI